jgi:Holliday junction resolvase RusA-like endonuclease
MGLPGNLRTGRSTAQGVAALRDGGRLVGRFEATILGKPEPAGSKTAIPLKNRFTGKWITDASGRPVINVIDDNPRSAAWKKTVAAGVRKLWRFDLLNEPVIFWAKFSLARPQYHYRSGRYSAELRPDAPAFPGVKPDVLKLARAVEDALTGVVWTDDALIIEEHLLKVWGPPGVAIAVEAVMRDVQGELFETRW